MPATVKHDGFLSNALIVFFSLVNGSYHGEACMKNTGKALASTQTKPTGSSRFSFRIQRYGAIGISFNIGI
ncbi:hypothetical protein [Pyrodictium abyssi]|uniref:Secreted protein n=1 Tax=Pyrodictium abyssi TaxID=54256 RepID=A0ABN6ZT23_9CREN|nr:hypothetical protein PABY_13820 [Pyrodictium abyssi]